jgi:predicted SAM-dependent methyltransferase
MRPVTKINLGCGDIHPPGWVNVDGSNRAWIASRLPWLDRFLVRTRVFPPTQFSAQVLYANLLQRFPWPDASADAFYLGEILEHFTREQGAFVLGECRRVLKAGGRIRIRVPDHANFWHQYIEEYQAIRAKPKTDWSLAHTKWTAMYFETICINRPKPWQSMGHFHKWMYDEVSLTLTLDQAGFADPRRRRFHDSDIPGIADVEARDDLIMEAVVSGEGHPVDGNPSATARRDAVAP